MSAINRFPRGLRVLITIAVLGMLIWLFNQYTSYPSYYFYYATGIAVLITALVIYLTYRKPSTAKPKIQKLSEEIPVESEEEIAEAELEAEKFLPGDILTQPNTVKSASRHSPPTPSAVESGEESPIPLIEDPSSLTLDEKNSLVNAVWYRCENPYCKFTSFLSVHHIVEEKAGGGNKLDNLIVLCPYCHDLAHRGEIPEKEMHIWIEDRAARWKFKPQWKYF